MFLTLLKVCIIAVVLGSAWTKCAQNKPNRTKPNHNLPKQSLPKLKKTMRGLTKVSKPNHQKETKTNSYKTKQNANLSK